jgi:hypothetical protein
MTRRLWTAQDQITAEVAAACGVSLIKIGRLLGRSHTMIRHRLNSTALEKAREFVRLYRAANPEASRDCDRRRRALNPEKHRQSSRRRRALNPEKHRQSSRRWAEANPEKIRENNRAWRDRNTEKCREWARRWNNENREKVRAYVRNRKAIKRAGDACALVPLVAEHRRKRFALFSNRCAFCGVDAKHPRNHGLEKLTEEHVLALSKGGIHESANIIPACKSCNCSKHNAPIEAWYRKQPFFTEARWRKIKRHCPAAVVGQLPLAFGPADEEAP